MDDRLIDKMTISPLLITIFIIHSQKSGVHAVMNEVFKSSAQSPHLPLVL